jgi:hypothetical protein
MNQDITNFRESYADHPDLRLLHMSEVPIYIIGCKYDLFKDLGSLERRTTLQILRFVAHYIGATVISTSAIDSTLRENFKAYMNCICFKTPLRQMSEFSSDRPVNISHGRDAYESILAGTSVGRLNESSNETSKGNESVCLFCHLCTVY